MPENFIANWINAATAKRVKIAEDPAPKEPKANRTCDLFARLPDEVVYSIFCNLDCRDLEVCRQVCRRWNKCVLTPSLWKSLHLSGDTCTIKLFRQLLDRAGRHLRLLSIRNSSSLCDSALSYLTDAKAYQTLEVLDLSHNMFSNDSLLSVFRKVRWTNLHVVNLRGTAVNDHGFQALYRAALNLKSVDLSNCPNIRGRFRLDDSRKSKLSEVRLQGNNNTEGDIAFFARCPELTLLDLSESNWLSVWGLSQLGMYTKRLQILRCGGLVEHTSAFTIGDVFLTFASACENLREFSIQSSSIITDECVDYLATFCKNLIVVEFGSCGRLTDAAICALATSCRSLQRFSISSCLITDNSIQLLARNCKQLTSIGLSDCSTLTDAVLDALSECKLLRSVWLTNGRYNGSGVVSLLEATHMKVVDISGCRMINADRRKRLLEIAKQRGVQVICNNADIGGHRVERGL